ncbi:pilin [Shimazuella sp. AN120528]|uniref:pilin n=1 Tax=Shimazuella soli TaxID=1892854 RepID=UPI001F0FC5E1|nr:pilin [Shimazuella soli]MCH5585064.1 pilin [Shimazuella soli]
MNWQIYHFLAANPFAKISKFLTNDVINGLLSIATPIATLAFIGLGIASMLASDEHARAKLKSGMWWVGAAAALCFMAKNIVSWLDGAF